MSHRRRRAPGKGAHEILDAVGLAGLVRQAVDDRYGGSQREAARALLGPQASPAEVEALRQLIRRLAAGKMRSITKRTLRLIGQLVGVEKHRLLVGPDGLPLLFPPIARMRYALYQRWVDDTLNRPYLRNPLASRTDHLEQQLRGEHGDLFRSFDRSLELLPGGPADQRHVEVVRWPRGQRRAVRDTPRALLAFREVLSPLMRDRVTGGIERGAAEMSRKEMRSYLRHAFAAQRILLRRDRDTNRALFARGPVEKQQEVGPYRPDLRATSRPGWRVTGGRKPAAAARKAPALPELAKALGRCRSVEHLNVLVEQERELPTPRKGAVTLLLQCAKRLETSTTGEGQYLTNELKDLLAAL